MQKRGENKKTKNLISQLALVWHTNSNASQWQTQLAQSIADYMRIEKISKNGEK